MYVVGQYDPVKKTIVRLFLVLTPSQEGKFNINSGKEFHVGPKLYILGKRTQGEQEDIVEYELVLKR